MSQASRIPQTASALKALTASLRVQVSEQTQQIESQTAQLQSQIAQIETQTAQLKHLAVYIEKLQFELARLKRWRFGATSEAVGSEQIALWEADLDGDIAAAEARLEQLAEAAAATAPETAPSAPPKIPPTRKPLPDTLPRVEERHDLAACTCPDCGLGLTPMGEEISEQLDIIPAQFFVRRHIRAKYSCRHCATVHTAPMPAQPIDRGLAAPGLLAHVLASKYLDHLPLYRQEQIYARDGVTLPRSTMAGWLGQLEVLLEPLVERLATHVLATAVIQADETPVPVLQPGNGRTATGYLWAYRSGPWQPTQAVVFDFAMSRGQAMPTRFLRDYQGVLQVDGYAGYNEVLRHDGVIEAGCMAHARRNFVEVWEATKSPAAQTAITEIARLYAIESEVRDLPTAERQRHRQARAGPILDAFRQWLEAVRAKTAPRSSLGKAIQYALNRWPALIRYVDDGRINIDNNPVENAIRGIALGRKNFLFCGSEGGGHRAALMYSLIESAKLNGINPKAYLVDVLTRLPTAKRGDLDALMPWNFVK
jgi:transposase